MSIGMFISHSDVQRDAQGQRVFLRAPLQQYGYALLTKCLIKAFGLYPTTTKSTFALGCLC